MPPNKLMSFDDYIAPYLEKRQRVIDLTVAQPDAPQTRKFAFDGIVARVTPYQSIFVLDFLWANTGDLVRESGHFQVWHANDPVELIPPSGSVGLPGYQVQVYHINSSDMYEVRRNDGRTVIKTITFPPAISFH
ncbi:hypothetical protein BD410DRAFT_792491 [Rickenella mellea]|uniref:Uncharacterized protein n=1 Tax=Rickenella mellea TaxID=50990 RepID=A0A4Y7PUH6_9AGAM|nr:hypothetical protein BD410DRAFT_792491 [Rickenella mellea]